MSRALHGDAALWGVSEHILAHIADLLAGANWQRGNEGAKTPSPKPEPFPRPGTQPQRPSGADMRDWARRHGQEAT